MKVDNVEINGFDTVVIKSRRKKHGNDCATVVFKKVDDWVWERDGKPNDRVAHREMVNKIKSFTYSPWHRVWINGSYVNIYPWVEE
jgi:hypothetical protein